MRNYYLLLEVLPVLTWAYGHYLQKKYTRYPEMSHGYPSPRIKRSRQAWELGNQLMAKSIKSAAMMMILVNVIFFFLNITNYGFATALNFFVILIGGIAGELKLRQMIDEKGNVIKTTKIGKQKASFKK